MSKSQFQTSLLGRFMRITLGIHSEAVLKDAAIQFAKRSRSTPQFWVGQTGECVGVYVNGSIPIVTLKMSDGSLVHAIMSETMLCDDRRFVGMPESEWSVVCGWIESLLRGNGAHVPMAAQELAAKLRSEFKAGPLAQEMQDGKSFVADEIDPYEPN